MWSSAVDEEFFDDLDAEVEDLLIIQFD